MPRSPTTERDLGGGQGRTIQAAPEEKKGGGIAPAPERDEKLLGNYHSNRAPTRTCRGVWKAVSSELPPFTG
jgi:hypothetical protein